VEGKTPKIVRDWPKVDAASKRSECTGNEVQHGNLRLFPPSSTVHRNIPSKIPAWPFCHVVYTAACLPPIEPGVLVPASAPVREEVETPNDSLPNLLVRPSSCDSGEIHHSRCVDRSSLVFSIVKGTAKNGRKTRRSGKLNVTISLMDRYQQQPRR